VHANGPPIRSSEQAARKSNCDRWHASEDAESTQPMPGRIARKVLELNKIA
jgi:hypothetical protein